MPTVNRWLLCGALLASVGACSREPPRVERPRTSLLAETDAPTAFQSPAKWRYHPKEEAPLFARYELDADTALFAGERGERWLVDDGTRLRAAPRLAPESIVAILRSTAESWLFLGATGTIYEADEPLGSFTRSSAPVEPMARLDATRQAIVGVQSDGTLIRSEGSAAVWQPVGPVGSRFVDVVLTKDGSGLALEVPEALFHTRDHGATWNRLDVAPTGAVEFDKDRRAGVVIQTALGRRSWDPKQPERFKPMGRSVSRSKYKLPVPPPRGPDAEPLAVGRATILDGQYLEVTQSEGRDERWELVKGPVGQALKRRRLDIAEECRSAKIAAFDRFAYVACLIEQGRDGEVVRFYRSQDSAKSFKLEPYVASGRFQQLRMAVGAKGTLLVTGVCAEVSRGCKAQGVYYRRPGRPPKKRAGKRSDSPPKKRQAFELGRSAVPALPGVAAGLAFSTDGRTAYVVGRRTTGKRGGLAIYVSSDAGKTFQAREVEVTAGGRGDIPAVVGITPAEDGTVAVILTNDGDHQLVVADDDGRPMAISTAPVSGAVVGAVGTRAIAILPQSAEAWESLDGGASWESIGPLPLSLCKPTEESSCDVLVSCHIGGCVIGSKLSRLGWREPVSDTLGTLAPPARGRRAFFDRKLRTPITCTLDESPWQRLEGVRDAPGADDAALSEKVAWFAASVNVATASVNMHHVSGGRRPRVDTTTLLAPARRPRAVAFSYQPQLEGGVALRYEIPAPNTPIRNAEVVWDNVVEGVVGRATIADGGPYSRGDSVALPSGSHVAKPHLLSIAPGGVHVRFHSTSRNAQRTFYVDGKRVTSVPGLSWPRRECNGARNEMTRIDGVSVPFCRAIDGAAFIRAKHASGRWQFDAYGVSLTRPGDFGFSSRVTLAYRGKVPGLFTSLLDPMGVGEARFYPLEAGGAALGKPKRMPTVAELGDRPRACNRNERTKSPRMVVPYADGTRHPVLITGVTEPMRVMLTERAIIQGTKKRPCATAFDAVSLDAIVGKKRERALLLLDDLGNSWMFKPAQADSTEGALEYRTMSCRFDPRAEIPPEVYGEPGVRVRRMR